MHGKVLTKYRMINSMTIEKRISKDRVRWCNQIIRQKKNYEIGFSRKLIILLIILLISDWCWAAYIMNFLQITIIQNNSFGHKEELHEFKKYIKWSHLIVSGNLKRSLMNSDGKNELNVKTKCKIIMKGINMPLMYADKKQYLRIGSVLMFKITISPI